MTDPIHVSITEQDIGAISVTDEVVHVTVGADELTPISITEETMNVAVTDEIVHVSIMEGTVGPPGPPGPAGSEEVIVSHEPSPTASSLELWVDLDATSGAIEGPPGPIGPQGPPGSAILSFLRAFGPDTSSNIPANAWTAIVLDPAGEPWRQFGTAMWEWIGPGDPDYSLSPAGIRCLKEGVYDLAGSVVFNQSQGTGTRAVRVIEVKGPYAGQWQLTQSIPMPKGNLIPVMVSGESYQYAGNIIELQAWTDSATSTMNNPQSEWLSATFIAGP